MVEWHPFRDDAVSLSVGDLALENGRRAVVVHGSLEIARDRQGLERARRLRDALDAVVRALEASDLPERVETGAARPESIRNPFA